MRRHAQFLGFIPMFVTWVLLAAILGHSASAAAQSDEERDFVPGEKTVFVDDYSDMTKGSAMPHWKVRGGTTKLCSEGTCVQLKGDGSMTPNIAAMPKNFTIETEVRRALQIPYCGFKWRFTNAAGETVWSVGYDFDVDPGKVEVTVLNGDEYLGKTMVAADYTKPLHLSVWFQDNRLRAYLNEQKVVDANQLEMKPWKTPVLDFGAAHAEAELPTLGTVRIAESVPDIGQVLLSTGKYVSHAIQFDVNSDQLRPESMNVLTQIADALKKKPAMKVRIEGHTDATGDAAKNLELSKRRAESVKSALVKMGVGEARMTTDGLGQTKPIGSNDTVQGRAENRRVEFIGM
jgi:outer membrane protein OmpA-like peptidoglycan-associated protein